jgi:DNA-binding NarL/FixJ family response regulator
VIRALVVDDQPLVRAGLRMVFEPEPDVRIVGEAADGDEAVRGIHGEDARRPRAVEAGAA